MTFDYLAHAKTILASADAVFALNDRTSATMLYFKAVFVHLDGVLLKKAGKTPKDHGERFTLLRKHEPTLYTDLDINFRIYRDTYNSDIDRETCIRISRYAHGLIDKA